MFLEELGDDHVDVLVFLFATGAKETEVLSCVSSHLTDPLTQSLHRHGKVSRGIQQLPWTCSRGGETCRDQNKTC